ncbi:hypothetical protein psyc5s11_48220 [Clostridium gelidum]|uniref:Uncharacterized protein n=1 Tax=Clostridium gelidum TaxID=704125 RepID=A0ABN6J5D8_9CLOT|nr:hypothetical protein [Clostridium gelidum]BCZ48755.1 hypothetical protein psyc5s11_48220 [Clostridium gelidum]
MRIGNVEVAIIDVITFIGIIITFLTGVFNLFQNKKSLYINNITKFRVIWITTLRGHIANLKELSNITNLYIITKDGTNKISYRRELEKNVSLIKMYLDFTSKLDIELISKIEELKATINSYLLLYYCINTIKAVDNDDELVTKFNEAVDIISEKKVLVMLLNLVENKGKIQNRIQIEDANLLDLRNNVKVAYMDDCVLIKEILKQSDYIINDWENEIESLNKDIDHIVQIYLKAEWIRCKIETRMWPFSRYNEEKVVNKLQKEYKVNSKKYAGFKV